MDNRILARLTEIERRLTRMDDKFRSIREWQRWAEQRIRELSQMMGGNVAGMQSADDIANLIHATGVITTEVTKATSATVPGEGAFERRMTFDASGLLLGDLTGIPEPIFSIDLDFKIVVDATVHAIKWQGVWWVVMVDSCTNLDAT